MSGAEGKAKDVEGRVTNAEGGMKHPEGGVIDAGERSFSRGEGH